MKQKELNNPKLLDPGIQIKYLSEKERKEYRITILPNKEGCPEVKDFNGLSLKDGVYMFVKGPDGLLYAGMEIPGQFHHSSFFAGKSVQSSGKLFIKDGLMIAANSKSGHYRPTEKDNLRFLNGLKEDGVNLDSFNFTAFDPNQSSKPKNENEITNDVKI